MPEVNSCESCKFDQICCCADAWNITLTIQEAKKISHAKLPNGTFIIASSKDGYCAYRNPKTGKCMNYDDRPLVCRKFTCEGKEEDMKNLQERYKKIIEELNAKYTGFFVSYVTTTDQQKMASSLIIKDLETGKEIQLMPRQIFGNSVSEVREKIQSIIEETIQPKSSK